MRKWDAPHVFFPSFLLLLFSLLCAMRIAVFNAKAYDREFLGAANHAGDHELRFLESSLSPITAPLASGSPAVCAFVNDDLGAETLKQLHQVGVQFILLRCAGFDRLDLATASQLGLRVARVPAYSPYGVAEHAVAMILTLNRQLHRAYNRVREGNFSLVGLLGFELRSKTVGIIGTGKIGRITGQILAGFGCTILAYDPYPNAEFSATGAQYLPLPELLGRSDIVSLHCPLTPETQHLINAQTIAQLKPGAMLVNTSRGGLIDTPAVIEGLKSKQIGFLAMDVYEAESGMFFEDLSGQILQDDVFQRLVTFPNVLITGHQAFFTDTALSNIAQTTLANATDFALGNPCANELTLGQAKPKAIR